VRDTETLLEEMTLASRYFFRIITDCLGTHTESAEISAQQYRALAILALRGPRNASVLADELGVGRPSATKLVDRLERRKLIRRRRHGTDRRQVILETTERGAHIVRAVQRCRRRKLERVLDSLEAADREALTTALPALNEAFGKTGVAGPPAAAIRRALAAAGPRAR
jgi:DNA-binding MarR family transcriptional regulator